VIAGSCLCGAVSFRARALLALCPLPLQPLSQSHRHRTCDEPVLFAGALHVAHRGAAPQPLRLAGCRELRPVLAASGADLLWLPGELVLRSRRGSALCWASRLLAL